MWRAGRRAPILCCTPRPWAPQPPRPQVETLPGEHATAFLHSGAAGGRRARRLRALGMIFAEDRTCHDASCGREIVYALPLSSCLFFSLLPPPPTVPAPATPPARWCSHRLWLPGRPVVNTAPPPPPACFLAGGGGHASPRVAAPSPHPRKEDSPPDFTHCSSAGGGASPP